MLDRVVLLQKKEPKSYIMKTTLIGLLLAASATCMAGNVIHNGAFNTGVQGWRVINGGDCMSWTATEGNTAKGAMKVVNAEANADKVWSTQIEGEFTTPLPAGNVTITYNIKCLDGTGTMRASTATVGHYEADQNITTSFQTVTWSFTAKGGETALCFDLGAVANTYIIDDVSVVCSNGSSTGGGCTPDLHVEGKYLKDPYGNTVNLHGVMDTPSMWFNSNRWSSWNLGGYVEAAIPLAEAYFTKIFDAITDRDQGAYCDIFRLHMEPAWLRKDGVTSSGENDLATTYDRDKVKTYLEKLFLPIAQDANEHGLYVIMRPPGVCPEKIQVGDDYQKYLLDVWDIVSSNEFVKANAGWLSLELANEPVQVYDANGNRSTDGTWGPANGSAKTDFFQPIINKIRANGFTGIIWVPGEGYQSSYQSYATYPISDSNFGYAIHVYPGWYGQTDASCSASSFISNMQSQVPGITSKPVCITECDWSPGTTDGEHYDGTATGNNYGTWGTARTSTWGNALKETMDYFGNMSLTLTSTDDYVNMDTFIATGKVQPAFLSKADAGEACGVACFNWYKTWSTVDKPACEDNGSTSIVLNASDAVLIQPTALTLTANVTTTGTVSNVIFYDGDDILGKDTLSPYTLTVSDLAVGKHTIYAYATDVNTSSVYDSVIVDVHVPQQPYTGVAANIPGTIEAENFDLGGEGFAYHDTDEANNGGGYRLDESVDVKSDTANGTRLGWTVEDEWLEYTVNVLKDGVYKVEARVSTDNDVAAFHLEMDDEVITDEIQAVNTGDWNTYAITSATTKALTAGEHVLKLVIDGSYFDIDYLTFAPNEATGIALTDADGYLIPAGRYVAYNALGMTMGTLLIDADTDIQSEVNGLSKGSTSVVILKSMDSAKTFKMIMKGSK